MMKTTIRAADIQPGDQFAGATVDWITVGISTVTVHFGDTQIAYYNRDDSVTVMRDSDSHR